MCVQVRANVKKSKKRERERKKEEKKSIHIPKKMKVLSIVKYEVFNIYNVEMWYVTFTCAIKFSPSLFFEFHY